MREIDEWDRKVIATQGRKSGLWERDDVFKVDRYTGVTGDRMGDEAKWKRDMRRTNQTALSRTTTLRTPARSASVPLLRPAASVIPVSMPVSSSAKDGRIADLRRQIASLKQTR